MLTGDLHFHPNLAGLPKYIRDRRLKTLRSTFQGFALDFQACTEHSFKKPLQAYQALAEATQDISTEIIPGVESLSKEGIDCIFLFRDEDCLKRALPRIDTYFWSIDHVWEISRDMEAVTILPHPFFFSRAAGRAVLGMGGYKQLLSQVDYVEIHNGAALNANRILANRRLRCRLRKTVRRINWTLDLPVALRGVDLGWSVGSDAHLPVEQYVAGRTEQSPVQGESIFDFLKRRIKFFPYQLRDVPSHILGNNYRVVRSLGSAWTEFLNKKSLRLRKGLTGPGKQSSTP